MCSLPPLFPEVWFRKLPASEPLFSRSRVTPHLIKVLGLPRAGVPVGLSACLLLCGLGLVEVTWGSGWLWAVGFRDVLGFPAEKCVRDL